MAYFDQEPIDITPRFVEPEQDALPSIDMLFAVAEDRSRHIGQGVLDLDGILA